MREKFNCVGEAWRWGAILALGLCPVAAERASGRDALPPFEETARAGTKAGGEDIDQAVEKVARRSGLQLAPLCSDAVFIRRVHVDLIGGIPEAAEVTRFLADRDPAKRGKLVEALLVREEFADYWATRWCDMLRVKAEFPINLWPNAVQAYHHWIRTAIRDGMPYDRFARELLTASGSNFRVGPVNFYRACQGRTPEAIASTVALTWMGSRVETWPEAPRKHLATFFSRIAYKATGEWKEEIVCLDPAATTELQTSFPDGRGVTIAPGTDPRTVFAAWLLKRDNPWFARAMVNRTWAWMMGRGIIHEPDDIHPGNPATHPELLEELERGFVADAYDFRKLLQRIVLSRTYQQSSIPAGGGDVGSVTLADKLFARYPPRRLDAEVLSDALSALSGVTDTYMSMVPEPFTFIPNGTRATALADGSVTSPFLELFGRSSRDTGLFTERSNEPSDGQRLHMLNSSHTQRKILRSGKLQSLMAGKDGGRVAENLYLAILSRPPSPAEFGVVSALLGSSGGGNHQAAEDLAWVLINSKEFQFRH